VRFVTQIQIGTMALIAASAAATIGTVAFILERSERRNVEIALVRSAELFESLEAAKRNLFRSESRVVSEEPRLKAVVASEDVSDETVLGVADELRRTLGCELFLVTDGSGHLRADVEHPEERGHDLSALPVVAKALAEGEASDVWTRDQAVLRVEARRLAFGKTVVGVLVIGYRLNDQVAAELYRATEVSSVVLLDQSAIVASPFPGATPDPRDLASLDASPSSPRELALAGERYFVLAHPFPGYKGEKSLRYAVLRSLDRALAPARQVARVLYGLGAAALIGALILSLILARRLARPLGDLVTATERIARGDLSAFSVVGPLEVRALGDAMNRMTSELDHSRKEQIVKERLEKELEIASRIQTSILPAAFEVPGLEVSACMIPAAEVGGDYYDVVRVADGCWIGIGDVAGHGLDSGLVMLMVQSTIAGLAKKNPDASPSELIAVVNETLYENIRERLKMDEHVTLTLFRYRPDGRLTFAGAHEEIILCREGEQLPRRIETPGPWLGGVRNISAFLDETTLQLQDGDLIVLYTDGITEAKDGLGNQFGMDRLCTTIQGVRARSVDEIRARVVEAVRAWSTALEDDISLVVLRYR
jgi:phosphoserine phosphatase RsbU/P